jgi:fructose-1,6-bisphosphatase I / sedoheptulose-1,7-bisphosphatase
MMLADRTTLNQFLIEERRRHPEATSDLNALINDVTMACKLVAARVAQGALGSTSGSAETLNALGERQHKLDLVANEIFLRCNEWGGRLAGMFSEEMDAPFAIPVPYQKGRYLLIFDPLDGSSNIDVNVSIGSIFSILRAPRPGADAAADDFLQPGAQQVCAGYAIYGPATIFVITVGTGVYAFTLEPEYGEFILTRAALRVPSAANEFAINASNSRFWEPAVKRYVEECLAGRTGPRQKDFNMRWVASLVAETHRILMRGGVFLYPRDTKEPVKPGRLRLLYEANPISFIIEQAGGLASTGRERIMNIKPTNLHHRVPFVFGASDEVDLVEAYHREQTAEDFDAPLFGSRGLFRATA